MSRARPIRGVNGIFGNTPATENATFGLGPLTRRAWRTFQKPNATCSAAARRRFEASGRKTPGTLVLKPPTAFHALPAATHRFNDSTLERVRAFNLVSL